MQYFEKSALALLSNFNLLTFFHFILLHLVLDAINPQAKIIVSVNHGEIPWECRYCKPRTRRKNPSRT